MEICKCILLCGILISASIIAYRLGDKASTDKQILSNVQDINWAGKMYTEWIKAISNPSTYVDIPKMKAESEIQ